MEPSVHSSNIITMLAELQTDVAKAAGVDLCWHLRTGYRHKHWDDVQCKLAELEQDIDKALWPNAFPSVHITGCRHAHRDVAQANYAGLQEDIAKKTERDLLQHPY